MHCVKRIVFVNESWIRRYLLFLCPVQSHDIAGTATQHQIKLAVLKGVIEQHNNWKGTNSIQHCCYTIHILCTCFAKTQWRHRPTEHAPLDMSKPNCKCACTMPQKLPSKVWTLVIAPLTWVWLVTSSALQSRKWQLIGMSQWCHSALCGTACGNGQLDLRCS